MVISLMARLLSARLAQVNLSSRILLNKNCFQRAMAKSCNGQKNTLVNTAAAAGKYSCKKTQSSCLFHTGNRRNSIRHSTSHTLLRSAHLVSLPANALLLSSTLRRRCTERAMPLLCINGAGSGRRQVSIWRAPQALARALRLPAFGIAAGASVLAFIDAKLKQASDYSKSIVDQARAYAESVKQKVFTVFGVEEMQTPEWLRKILRLENALDSPEPSYRGNPRYKEAQSKPGTADNSRKREIAAGAVAAGAAVETASAHQLVMTETEADDEATDEEDQLERDGLMTILTRKMIEIKNILSKINKSDNFVSLPGIVVIGSQSSGKSSVLEAIVGEEFLPKGINMVTRRPIELTLIHNPLLTQSFGEFPGLGLGKITDYAKIKQILTDLNQSVHEEECISIDPIRLTISSPNVPDLTLVDLPGYIQVSSRNQPEKLREKIIQLCEKYILEPNIILAVCAADVDLANSPALRASRQLDPEGMRTIGVITKMDLVAPERGAQILKNLDYPLKNGYIGVVCKLTDSQRGRAPSKININGNTSSSHGQQAKMLVSQRENAFFGAIDLYRDDPEIQTGTLNLRRKLLYVLEASMAKNLHRTIASVRQELDETSYRFKAKFNDRSLTPESYLAETVDTLKLRMKQLSQSFAKNEVRLMLKSELDQQSLNIIAEQYWMDPQSKTRPYEVDDDEAFWSQKLDQLSSVFTKIGVGRLSTTIVAQELVREVEQIAAHNTMSRHNMLRDKINRITEDIIKTYFKSTADQIENCIKPFKYEIEVEENEWDIARARTISLLEQEAKNCNEIFRRMRKEIGAVTLKQIFAIIHGNSLADFEQAVESIGYNKATVNRAMKALFIQNRIDVLNMRIRALKSRTCRTVENKRFCPEIFANCVADKLTKTASLFLSVELLSQFFYEFPRRLDHQILYSLSEDEVYQFACEDPDVREHIELQRKKELLELAAAKLNAILQLEKDETENIQQDKRSEGRRKTSASRRSLFS